MMRIIDCHYHNRFWSTDGECYLDTQKRYREQFGIDTINVLCAPGIENGSPNGGAGHNIMAAILKLEDEKVYAQGGLIYPWSHETNPTAPEYDLKTQVKEMMELGFDGVKMMESKPTTYKKLPYRIDSEYYKEFFAYLEEEQIPLLWHVADPEEFWDPEKVSDNAKEHGWFYGDGTYPTREQVYKEVYAILERHPKIKLVLAHCFFISGYPEQMKELLDTYENVCIDLTPGPEMFRDFSENREVWRELFEKYYNRFMFGTDINSGVDFYIRQRLVEDVVKFFTTGEEFTAFEFYGKEYAYTLRGFALDQEKCDYIFGKSFTEFMGGEPKKIDQKALKNYIERHAKHLSEGETKREILRYCKEKLVLGGKDDHVEYGKSDRNKELSL